MRVCALIPVVLLFGCTTLTPPPGQNSAYDRFLKRTLKQAEIVRSPTSPGVVDLLGAAVAPAGDAE